MISALSIEPNNYIVTEVCCCGDSLKQQSSALCKTPEQIKMRRLSVRRAAIHSWDAIRPQCKSGSLCFHSARFNKRYCIFRRKKDASHLRIFSQHLRFNSVPQIHFNLVKNNKETARERNDLVLWCEGPAFIWNVEGNWIATPWRVFKKNLIQDTRLFQNNLLRCSQPASLQNARLQRQRGETMNPGVQVLCHPSGSSLTTRCIVSSLLPPAPPLRRPSPLCAGGLALSHPGSPIQEQLFSKAVSVKG